MPGGMPAGPGLVRGGRCPPHKLGARTAAAHRLEMVRIAIAGHPSFRVSESKRRAGPHYSVETLESVRRDRPGDDLFFLIGADSLADLPYWREPGKIAQLATIIVVNRPGLEEVDPASLPDFGPGSRPLMSVTIPPIGVASTDLHRRLAEGRTIRYMVPRGSRPISKHRDCIEPELRRFGYVSPATDDAPHESE